MADSLNTKKARFSSSARPKREGDVKEALTKGTVSKDGTYVPAPKIQVNLPDTKKKGDKAAQSRAAAARRAQKMEEARAAAISDARDTYEPAAPKKFDYDKAVKRSKDKRTKKQRWATVGIIVFAAVMALAMLLPSFSVIFTSQTQQQTAANTSEPTTEQVDTSTLDGLETAYKKVIDPLEAKLAQTPDDLATLLNLGNDYMNWGYNASQIVVSKGTPTNAEAERVLALFSKAIEYYDKYLALNDSSSVKVNRALCELYSGQTTTAITDLETVTTQDPTYGPAWANLGLAYESASNTSKAKEMYEKAKEVDANDEYGAKTFAGKRLLTLQNQESSDAAAATGQTSTNTPQGLSSALSGGIL